MAGFEGNEERPSTAEDGEEATMQTQIQNIDMPLESTQVLENTQDQDMDLVPSLELKPGYESRSSLDIAAVVINDVSAVRNNDSTPIVAAKV